MALGDYVRVSRAFVEAFKWAEAEGRIENGFTTSGSEEEADEGDGNGIPDQRRYKPDRQLESKEEASEIYKDFCMNLPDAKTDVNENCEPFSNL